MKKYSNLINGLRGLIAIIIALFHYEQSHVIANFKIFETGYLGVEFFFILSGFLLANDVIKKKKVLDAKV